MNAFKYAKKTTEDLYLKGKFPITFTEHDFRDFVEKVYKDGMDAGRLEPKEESDE